jgi:hypothetical protein
MYRNFFARFGLPCQLHSDQGRNFESQLMKELCLITGIHRTRTTPFHPRSDGLTERANRTILQMLRTSTADSPDNWPHLIPAVLAAHRMTPHAMTGVTSPNMAMLGREVLLPCALIATPPQEPTEVSSPPILDFRDRLRDAHQRICVTRCTNPL